MAKASVAKAINSIDGSDVISKRAQIPYNRLKGFEKGKVGQQITEIILAE